MNNKTNIIIIDDEQAARQNLRKIIEQFCDGYHVVAEAGNALEGIKQIKKYNAEIVLLDIEMPGGSGFDMLDAISEQNISIIFITAYNHYAIKAFKYNAIDYLLKPVDIDELTSALEKAKNQKKATEIKPIVEDIQNKTPFRLAISTQNETEFVQISSITRMEPFPE